MNIVAEREWREASDMRRSTLTLTGILAVAAVLRFWALGAGIPQAIAPDEFELMSRAVGMMRTGSFDPQQFDNPGFYVHLQLAVAIFRFLVGATGGAWHSLDQAAVEDFLVWARAVSALFGTLTVLVVFHIAMRWGSRYAMLAAGLLAVMPLHVRESHAVVTEIPLTFFVAVACLRSLHAYEVERAGAFVTAGVAAGLAAATQYAGVLALLLPLVAVSLAPSGRMSRGRALGAVLGGAAAAFLVAAPYVVLNLPGFLDGAARVAAGYWSGDPAPDASRHYLRLLRLNLHWPALMLTIAGTTLALVRGIRGPGRVRWTMAVLFPLAYFWLLRSQTIVHDRLVLAIVPLLCILAAVAVVSGVSLLRRFDIPRAARTALIVSLTIAALLPPLLESIGLIRMMGRRSTAAMAYDWILANVAPGSRLVVEPGVPHLPETYRVQRVPTLIEQDREAYIDRQITYLVASSAAFGAVLTAAHERPAEYDAYMQLMGLSREVARFTPDEDRPGPELRIYAPK